jgi:hypothetical protein
LGVKERKGYESESARMAAAVKVILRILEGEVPVLGSGWLLGNET